MFKRKKSILLNELSKNLKKNKDEHLPPFEKREKVHSLLLLVTIISRNQGAYFTDTFSKHGASLSISMFAHSMPPADIISFLGNESTTKKDLVLTIVRKDEVKEYLDIIKKRFSISKASKGIAFTLPVSSVSGIVVYKYLSDYNKEERTMSKEENKEEIIQNKENDFELIMAIVNKGLTDLVMEAARKKGARGGTISVARGTGNSELAKYYGVVIQPEKEIVYIVVKKEIKDDVMKAIYDEAGLDSKGQGIIISLPISDTVGLEKEVENTSVADNKE